MKNLVWIGERLLSAGLEGVLSEWDLDLLEEMASTDSYGGPVWDIALNRSQKRLAAATEDGTIRIFDIATPGEFIFLCRLASKQQGGYTNMAEIWLYSYTCLQTDCSASPGMMMRRLCSLVEKLELKS